MLAKVSSNQIASFHGVESRNGTLYFKVVLSNPHHNWSMRLNEHQIKDDACGRLLSQCQFLSDAAYKRLLDRSKK